MRNRAYLTVALLGLLTFALAPGYAAAAVQGQNLTEIALASDAAARASVVSATIDVAPLAADLGIVNIGESNSTIFVITNGGDNTLNISSVISNNPAFSVVSFPATVSGSGGSGNLTVSFNPTTGTNQSGVITINSDASNGMAFGVNVTGSGNAAPVLAAIGNKLAPADLPLNFSAVGSDAGDQVDDILTYSVAPALPPGATFDTNTGAFAWTPTTTDAGTYTLTFCVSDGRLDDCETIDIVVTATNAKPIADAGGPYTAGANQAVQFNGTGSSDPDGDNLTFAWNFGDGSPVGVGPSPTHAYTLLGNYLASLTVTDDGVPSLSSDPDLASVQIINALPGGLVIKVGQGGMRVQGGSNQKMGLELTQRPVSDIDVATIRLSTTFAGAGSVSQISPLAKGVTIGDLDNDNIPDLDVIFGRDDLALLLGNVPNNTTITLVMKALTKASAGSLPIEASAPVKIKNTGPTAVSAFASPNPFNPATSVKYSLRKGGEVSVRIFSLDGRLVKTLVEGPAAAGTHEVLWDGRDNSGSSVRSGMYFVKTTSGGESAIFKLSLLK
jgi:PKD repeat protein